MWQNLQQFSWQTRNLFIYTFPEKDITNKIAALPFDQIMLFRQQIYNTFIDEFDWSTLEANGFKLSNEHPFEDQLKKRGNKSYAANDIYFMGLSIVENLIAQNIAKGIFKPVTVGTKKQTQSILDKNSNLIVQKLNEVLKKREKRVTEKSAELD